MIMPFTMKALSFIKWHFLIVTLVPVLMVFHSESLVLCQWVQGYSPTLSSIGFIVSGFMLKSLVHLDLNFVQGDMYGSTCIFLPSIIQCYQKHLLKKLSFLKCVFIHTCIYVYVYI